MTYIKKPRKPSASRRIIHDGEAYHPGHVATADAHQGVEIKLHGGNARQSTDNTALGRATMREVNHYMNMDEYAHGISGKQYGSNHSSRRSQ